MTHANVVVVLPSISIVLQEQYPSAGTGISHGDLAFAPMKNNFAAA